MVKSLFSSLIGYATNKSKASLAKIKSPIGYHGVLIPTDHAALNTGARIQFLEKDWETDEIELIDQYIEPRQDFIDLGACTGFLSAYIQSQSNGADGVAVEANPNLISLIEQTRDLNGLDFSVLNAGYHPTKNNAEFQASRRMESGSLYHNSGEPMSVKAANLEDIVTDSPIEDPVIISDIEGVEAGLILDELEVLEEFCPLFIVEYHPDYNDQVEKAKTKMMESNFTKVAQNGTTFVYRNGLF